MAAAAKDNAPATAEASEAPKAEKAKGKDVKVRMRERSYKHEAGQVISVPEATAKQLVANRVADPA